MQDDSMQGCLFEFLILYDTKRYFLLHNFVETDTEQRGEVNVAFSLGCTRIRATVYAAPSLPCTLYCGQVVGKIRRSREIEN